MQAVFDLKNPGILVSVTANAGPEYASRIAATIPEPEFQKHYAVLARYLKLFGPCQKKQRPNEEGWWSGYTENPGEAYCAEATKLVFAAALWSEVHYCDQLASGQVKAKLGPAPSHGPPYRLDEPPVATHWVIAGAVYDVADAAVEFRFQDVLRRHADLEDNPEERDAILKAAGTLCVEPVSRERVGLALLEVMVRRYEAVHLGHMRRFEASRDPAPLEK
jgi:hypothetical protein